jgi:hypothetical protein
VNLLPRREDKLALRAMRNRQAIIREGLSRRDLFKMGLLSGSGYLVLRGGLIPYGGSVVKRSSWSGA